MAKPEIESGQALTLSQLSDDVLDKLRRAATTDAELSARLIVEEVTGIEPRLFPLEQDRPVTQGAVVRADAMTIRRAQGEPLQYVLGHWPFRYLDLAVDARALIPRPETEVVAGFVINLLQSLSRDDARNLIVSDMGTGSGAIALSIAHEVLHAEIHATDVSKEALSLARSNLAGLGRSAARVQLYQGDWFHALPDELCGTLDALISNPPYVSPDYELPSAVADWEPSDALIGGIDGFAYLEYITRDGRQWLRPGGWLVLECGSDQAVRLRNLAIARGYSEVVIKADLAGNDRAVIARRPLDDVETQHLSAASVALHSGNLVVAPTDTLPGLLARYFDTEAVKASYRAKQRPFTEPVPVLVSGVQQADQLVELDVSSRRLIERHWPGALTVVARRRDGTDPVHGRTTLGVRCPEPGWLRLLIDDVGPVTGSSANLHGIETLDSAQDAAAELSASIVYVIPGLSPGGTASTVVDVTGDSPVVLRAGPFEEIELKLDT